MNKQLRTFKDFTQYDRVCQVERLINHYAIRIVNEGSGKAVYLREEEAERLADFILERRLAQHIPKLIVAMGGAAGKQTFVHVLNEEDAANRAMRFKEVHSENPVWLAQIIKQYLPTTPVYEWKSI
jgi:hypothetical protein